jgi:hypothetical protein
MTAAVVIHAPTGDHVVPATLVPRRGRVTLEAKLDGLEDLPSGRHPVALRLGDDADPGHVALGTGAVGGRTGLRIEGLARRSRLERLRSSARWVAGRGMARAWRIGRLIKRRIRPR